MTVPVRTRFAPSPTGYLHLGSLRTALFNYLWAKKQNGQFILRIEDTDQARLVDDATEAIVNDLKVLGLDWDFGPDRPSDTFGSCIQSQRLARYQAVAQQLLERGVAYYDYTSSDELQALRQQAADHKQAFIFRRSMARTTGKGGEKPVIRIAINDALNVSWQDAIKGQQSWSGQDVGDFVALKSDGFPTYQLANVVDDHDMQISHVIRSDEWLSSTPKHLYLFDQLNWIRPVYVHVPPILAPTGNRKLSKRDMPDRVSDLLQQAGYLKEALLNYICLLGWNPKTEQEIFSLDQLIATFDIAHIQVSGARFDPVRLDWFNGRHIRALSEQERFQQARAWWADIASSYPEAYLKQVLELVFERLKRWAELPELTDFFFQAPRRVQLADLSQQTRLTEGEIQTLLQATVPVLQTGDFTPGDLELKLYQLAQNQQTSPSKYFTLLRLKLTNRQATPGLFLIMHTLGQKECLQRLQATN